MLGFSATPYLRTSRRSATRAFEALVLYGTLLGILAVPAVASSSNTSTSLPVLPPAELQSYFDQMRHMLEEVHPGLYRYSTKSDMDRVFQSERSRLNRSMTKTEFWAVAAETIAQIRCGHTKMSLDDG